MKELIDHTQMLLQRSDKARDAFWKDADASSLEKWQASTKQYTRLLLGRGDRPLPEGRPSR